MRWARQLAYVSLFLVCCSQAWSQDSSSSGLTVSAQEESDSAFSEACSRIYNLARATGKREEGATILDLLAESEMRHETRYSRLSTTAKLADTKVAQMQLELKVSQTSSALGWTTVGTLVVVLGIILLLR